MLSEREYGPEIPVNPDHAYKFMMLLRGGKPHDLIFGYRTRALSEPETKEANQLIDEIVGFTPGVNKKSLVLMMFESPLKKLNPRTGRTLSIPYDFGAITRFTDLTTEDIWSEHRQLMLDHYLVKGPELRILRVGDREVEKRHPSPIYIFTSSQERVA